MLARLYPPAADERQPHLPHLLIVVPRPPRRSLGRLLARFLVSPAYRSQQHGEPEEAEEGAVVADSRRPNNRPLPPLKPRRCSNGERRFR